jgi:hypothetical protein
MAKRQAGKSDAGKSPVTLAIDVLLGWFIPGAGHLSRGYRRQGLITLGVVVALFGSGLFLSKLEAVSRDLHPYAFWAQVGFAGGTLPLLAIDPAADQVLPDQMSILKPVPEDRMGVWTGKVPPHGDTGVLFCCVAGLLNLLALFDLVDRSLSPQSEAKAVAAGRAP